MNTANVPRPTRRNPFKVGSHQAKMFDGILKTYADGHRDVVREGGTVRGMGNIMAVAFWRGYDGASPHQFDRAALAYACYRAGQAARLADDERGVFVPPKTNSGVPVR